MSLAKLAVDLTAIKDMLEDIRNEHRNDQLIAKFLREYADGIAAPEQITNGWHDANKELPKQHERVRALMPNGKEVVARLIGDIWYAGPKRIDVEFWK